MEREGNSVSELPRVLDFTARCLRCSLQKVRSEEREARSEKRRELRWMGFIGCWSHDSAAPSLGSDARCGGRFVVTRSTSPFGTSFVARYSLFARIAPLKLINLPLSACSYSLFLIRAPPVCSHSEARHVWSAAAGEAPWVGKAGGGLPKVSNSIRK
jgi:hypothetical protein